MASGGRHIGFWGLLWEAFLSCNGPVLGVCGVGVSILAWGFGPGVGIPLWAVALGCTITASLLVSLVQAVRLAQERAGGEHQVVDVRSPWAPYKSAALMCIVRTASPVAVGTSVSFFRVEDGVERPIGVGTVRHVQADQSVQATLDRAYEEVEQYVATLRDQQQKAIKELRVVTGFSAEHAALFVPVTKSQSTAEGSSAPPVASTGEGG